MATAYHLVSALGVNLRSADFAVHLLLTRNVWPGPSAPRARTPTHVIH